jgi:predicted helicase
MDDELANILRKVAGLAQLPQLHTHFDVLVQEMLVYFDKPVHSIAEMRAHRKTKTKGDLWERFCQLFLKHFQSYDEVWLLHEIPQDVRESLGLGTHDVGIDIVAKKKDKYTAVQCKFKKPRSGHVPGTWIPYNCVNWKELSTFYALCSRTNNNSWQHHIVMTNAKYVRRMGDKNSKDKSYCVGTFRKLNSIDFAKMISADGRKEESKYSEPRSHEELRALRLRFFEGTNANAQLINTTSLLE